ncbi:sulfatase [bacterium]|nr:sulfatase [bacterium]
MGHDETSLLTLRSWPNQKAVRAGTYDATLETGITIPTNRLSHNTDRLIRPQHCTPTTIHRIMLAVQTFDNENHIMRHLFLTLSAFSILAATSMANSLQAADRPNVLFISIDDLNDWVGFLDGHPDVKTPNMDRLAARGIIFTDAHCAAPICGPSRCAVMTGRRPNNTGLYTNAANIKALTKVIAKDPTIQTLPGYFRNHGYRTLGAGKLFHNGHPKGVFDDYGPTHSSGGRSGGPFKELDSAAQRPAQLFKQHNIEVMLPLNKMPDDRPWGSSNTFDWGPVDLPASDFSDGKVTQWALQELATMGDDSSDRSKPFFLGVGFFRPHQPLFNPKKFHDLYPPDSIRLPETETDDLNDIDPVGLEYALRAATSGTHATVQQYGRWREAISSYLASVSFVDSLIGQILDQLDRSPFADNTHIVLWSDHGFHVGEKQHWGKATGWHRATHVPLVIVPANDSRTRSFTPGRCSEPVNLVDLYPTLVEACGLPPVDGLDGNSLVPLMAKPATKAADAHTVTTWARGNHSVYTRDWHYMHYFDGSRELYSRKNDANEFKNVAHKPENRGVVSRLSHLAPQDDDVVRFVRSGPWKAVFPKPGAPMGDEPLLFETGFENQIEERSAETERFAYVLEPIKAYLTSANLGSKYVTLPDFQLRDLKQRLKDAKITTPIITSWHKLRPSEGLAYKSDNAVYIKLDTADGKKIKLPRLNNPVTKAYLASDTSQKPLDITPKPTEWIIPLPKTRQTKDVLVIETVGEPYLPIVPQVTEATTDDEFQLPAHRALVYGEKLCYEPLPHKNTVGYWVNKTDWAQWRIKIDKPGTYEIRIQQGCGKGQGGSKVDVHLHPAYPSVQEFKSPPDESTFQFTVEDTGHFQNFKWRTIGQLTAERTGWYSLQLKPNQIAKNAVMDVRAMSLRHMH